jgi:hypothetical protein
MSHLSLVTPFFFSWSISKLCLHFLFVHPLVRYTYTALHVTVDEFKYEDSHYIYKAVCSSLSRSSVLRFVLLTDYLSVSVCPSHICSRSPGGAIGYPEPSSFLSLSLRPNIVLRRGIPNLCQFVGHVPSLVSVDTVLSVQLIRHND